MLSSRNPPPAADVPALDQARTNYEMALAYDAKTVGWPGLHLGRLLYLTGDLQAAGDAFRASVASGHAVYAPVASYHLGRLSEDIGDTDTAITAYRDATVSTDPKQSSAATYRLGRLLAANGDIEGARTAFEVVARTKTWYGQLGIEALRALAAD